MLRFDQFAIPRKSLQQILDFLPYPFLISEYKEGTYLNIFLNEKFHDEIGYSLQEIPLIEDWFKMAYPDPSYRAEVMKGWNDLAVESRNKGLNYILMKALVHTKEHGDRWYEVKSSTLGNYQLVAFVNVHEFAMKEEELEKTGENQNKMLSILSHDLRGPLSNLNSLVQMTLNEHITQEEFRNIAQSISERSSQALEFLDTTLLWTKSNFDKVTVKTEEVRIANIVKSVLSLFDRACENKKIGLSTAVDTDMVIHSDSEILTIVLRNLISNAVKFTPDGGKIMVRSWKESESIFLAVQDSGVGMNEDTINRILNDQYASKVGTHAEKGLGIGLKLCRDLLKKIGGSIIIESKLDEGTLMKVIIKSRP
ncbi:MAG TPA: HAMP domain-containing sensor histidine kinase [Cyclobacteriaceae bacterium]|nr:HAMP domain-containing sensor histidine kinase [Cyclobacteriaceae bacterium]